jgi:glycolate oxidase FAD binding subunit
MPAVIIRPATLDQLAEAVRAAPLVQAVGKGTKTALAAPLPGATLVDITGMSGILEYEPGEYTFTAYAGTPLAEIAAALAEHGQFLPFNPPFVTKGATLGGTVAAGLAGPGRYHYGGVRDFILGVRYVDGSGDIIKGGGKVVKNAAGFDIPKLMVGSLGMFGVLAELTFKVFPEPRAYASIRAEVDRVDDALALLRVVTGGQMDVHALELVHVPAGWELWVRLSGLPDALPPRIARLRTLLGHGNAVGETEDAVFWADATDFRWAPQGWSLVKLPLIPGRIPALESALGEYPVVRRYSGGGQVCWLAKEGPADTLEQFTAPLGPALAVLGTEGKVRLGNSLSDSFEHRVKTALDPAGRFPVR